MNERKIKIDNHTIELSNLDKVFYPRANITKGDVIDYYQRISETMMPYLKDRPIVMHRFPDGIKKESFYQKDVPDYFPGWIGHKKIKLEKGGSQALVVVKNTSNILYIANQGVLVFHGWLSKKEKPHHPDRLIFDLDPPKKDKEGFSLIKFAAYKLRDIFKGENLYLFVMSTGSQGLHVAIPITAEHNFDKVRSFAAGIAEKLAKKYPEKFTIEHRKSKRGGKIFIDYLRNAYGQTSVVPYSLRALPDAPVATPLDWQELHSVSEPRKYNLRNIFMRLGRKKDPWQNFFKKAKRLNL